jgi:hypothetical protein
MKIKGNDTITANKEANMSECACEVEEEELLLYLCFPFSFNLDEI